MKAVTEREEMLPTLNTLFIMINIYPRNETQLKTGAAFDLNLVD